MTPFKTKIAGIPHRKPDLTALAVGDTVNLVPEPDNRFDPNAIKIVSASGVHLGYIPRTDTGLAAGMQSLFIHEIVPSRKWEEVIVANYSPV